MKIEYEMIVCIVNAGFSGDVMQVAKEKGAKGGTIIHARGTANKEAEKKFQIVINPEKDILLIVVKTDIKDEIMKAIYEKTGFGTNASGVTFSLPITHQIGIKS